MLEILGIIFTILVMILGLQFMHLGIKEKKCYVFYEGLSIIALAVLGTAIYFVTKAFEPKFFCVARAKKRSLFFGS